MVFWAFDTSLNRVRNEISLNAVGSVLNAFALAPEAWARAAHAPAKTSPCCAASPAFLVQAERSPLSKPSWKSTPGAAVACGTRKRAAMTLIATTDDSARTREGEDERMGGGTLSK